MHPVIPEIGYFQFSQLDGALIRLRRYEQAASRNFEPLTGRERAVKVAQIREVT